MSRVRMRTSGIKAFGGMKDIKDYRDNRGQDIPG